LFRFTGLIIFRLTRDCNLNCKYCFMQNKKKHKGEIIDFELFKKIINRIIDQRLINNIQNEQLTLVFHGGEALLLGEKKLYQILEYTTNMFNFYGINYRLGCQTNATLINDTIAKIFNKFEVHLGLSFDGINESNNSRTDIKQIAFEQKFSILKENKVGFGMIIVASKKNINNISESKKYLDSVVLSFKINYSEDMINPGENSEIEVNGQEMFNKIWLPEILEFIETGKDNEYHFKELIEKSLIDILTYHTNETRSGCGNKFCGAGISMIAIEPDGEMDYCDRYSKKFENAYMMHALDYDFLGLQQINKVIKYNVMKSKLYKEYNCDTCYADYICDHGCESFYYSKYGKYGIDTYLVCDQHKMFYDYVLKNIENIIIAFIRHNKLLFSRDEIIIIKNKWLNFFELRGIKLSIKDGKQILMENINGNK